MAGGVWGAGGARRWEEMDLGEDRGRKKSWRDVCACLFWQCKGLYLHQDVKFKFALKLLIKGWNMCLLTMLLMMIMFIMMIMTIIMTVMIMSPGGSELDPLVEESPIVELAEKTRLGDRVRGVTLRTNIFECSKVFNLVVSVRVYAALYKSPWEQTYLSVRSHIW